ncbi:MAG: VOC family protein [Pseudomonadaceae bacterium]|nr:VOC family protein [Pseudomonadaceae bacterium]
MTAPFSLMQLDHLVLRSEAPKRLIEFYCQLGAIVEREVADVGLVQLRMGSSILDIVDTAGKLGRSGGAAPTPDSGHNVDHFAWRIEPFDEDDLRELADSLGVPATFHSKLYGADGFGPAVYLRDPDGNRVELKGPPSQ